MGEAGWVFYSVPIPKLWPEQKIACLQSDTSIYFLKNRLILQYQRFWFILASQQHSSRDPVASGPPLKTDECLSSSPTLQVATCVFCVLRDGSKSMLSLDKSPPGS